MSDNNTKFTPEELAEGRRFLLQIGDAGGDDYPLAKGCDTVDECVSAANDLFSVMRKGMQFRIMDMETKDIVYQWELAIPRMDGDQIEKTKFTPGPWHVEVNSWELENGCYGEDYCVDTEDGSCVVDLIKGGSEAEEYYNAHLIAAAPEMYDSEEKNLSMLKVILESYEAMAGVILSDPDAKDAIESGALARQLPCAMPDVIAEVIRELKTRIRETAKLLAKARGEETAK